MNQDNDGIAVPPALKWWSVEIPSLPPNSRKRQLYIQCYWEMGGKGGHWATPTAHICSTRTKTRCSRGVLSRFPPSNTTWSRLRASWTLPGFKSKLPLTVPGTLVSQEAVALLLELWTVCGQVHHRLVSPLTESRANSGGYLQELRCLAGTSQPAVPLHHHQAKHNELRQVGQSWARELGLPLSAGLTG